MPAGDFIQVLSLPFTATGSQWMVAHSHLTGRGKCSLSLAQLATSDQLSETALGAALEPTKRAAAYVHWWFKWLESQLWWRAGYMQPIQLQKEDFFYLVKTSLVSWFLAIATFWHPDWVANMPGRIFPVVAWLKDLHWGTAVHTDKFICSNL